VLLKRGFVIVQRLFGRFHAVDQRHQRLPECEDIPLSDGWLVAV
jgi:hypothetical protein